MTTLLVDAGGTNLRTAWAERDGAQTQPVTLGADLFPSFDEALLSRCAEDGRSPDTAVIAVAGPVQDDTVTFTNRPWTFSQRALKQRLGLKALTVMNDFAAIALALPDLTAGHLETLQPGTPPAAPSAKLALGPGTGLGVSCAVPAGGSWIAVPGEGGHVAAALDHLIPRAAQERLWSDGWLPWEEVLSGRGLVRVHRALHPDTALGSADRISAAALSGDLPALATLTAFSAALGRRASDGALQVGAWGGVYLTGGILPKLGSAFDWPAFQAAFRNKGVYTELVSRIPVYRITLADPAFLGLRRAARAYSADWAG